MSLARMMRIFFIWATPRQGLSKCDATLSRARAGCQHQAADWRREICPELAESLYVWTPLVLPLAAFEASSNADSANLGVALRIIGMYIRKGSKKLRFSINTSAREANGNGAV